MTYHKQSWVDGPQGHTPLSAARMLHIEDGIASAAALVVNVMDYGAAGDGEHDDADAFAAALRDLRPRGGTLFIPPRTFRLVMTNARRALPLDAGTSVVGTPGSSRLLIDTDNLSEYRECFRTSGDDVTIRGLTITRSRSFSCVLLAVQGYARSQIVDCYLDGRRDTLSGQCHGIEVGFNGTVNDLQIRRCTLARLDYGLFQASAATAGAAGILVDSCTFTLNYADDLGFNAPHSTMTDVSVVNSQFLDNMRTSSGAGFGVAFANVSGGAVSGCSFTGYANEAIHLEAHSSRITVTGNRMARCGTKHGAYVQVLSGTFDCQFIGNLFDATANTNTSYVFNCVAGGTGSNGQAFLPPSRCVIANNVISLSPTYRAIYLGSVSQFAVHHNVGLNPLGKIEAPPVPQSGGSLTNETGYDVTVYVTGGAVIQILVGGAFTGVVSGGLRVSAGQSISIAYKSPPQWVWIGD